MARKSYWIKLLNSYLDDPKYMRLTDTAKAVYFELYMLASKSDAYGFVLDINDKPATIPDIAYLLHRDDSIVKLGMSELEAIEFISIDQDGVCVTRYADEQPNREEQREQWRKWQEDHRKNEKEKIEKALKDLKALNTLNALTDSSSDSDSQEHVINESGNVINDTNKNDDDADELSDLIISLYEQTTNKKAKISPAFQEMIEEFKLNRVRPWRVRNGFDDFKKRSESGVLNDITSIKSWILNAKKGWGDTDDDEEAEREKLRQAIAEDLASRQAEQPAQT